jgi:integration host factor subunit alpha
MNLMKQEASLANTITRAMLADAAAQRTGISRQDTSAICEGLFAMMGEALMRGENVKLTAFGSLQVRARAGRVGRNPRTGEEHPISSRHTVVFTPSAQLRQALDGLASERVEERA